MDGDEDEAPGGPKKAAKRQYIEGEKDTAVQGSNLDYSFIKPNHIRLYPENANVTEFKVYVFSDKSERIGNKSPIYLNHIFSTEIKGVAAVQRVNANKIVVIFKLANTANNFLSNTAFLKKYNLRAYIPAAQIERNGVIRFVPTNISCKELYSKLSSICEIIAVRRFTKKVGQERVPLQTVSLTFLTNNLPDNVQYDLFSYRVFEYIQPLQQCYRCFKFNHSAKVCNGKQRCSCCAGDHKYTDCDKPDQLCCANCGGSHVAVSKSCPIKIKKILEKRNKVTYASVIDTKKIQDFPTLSENTNKHVKTVNNHIKNTPVNKTEISNKVNKLPISVQPTKKDFNLKEQLLNNSDLTSVIIRIILDLSNTVDGAPINNKSVKEMLNKYLP